MKNIIFKTGHLTTTDELVLNQFCPILRSEYFQDKLLSVRESINYDGIKNLNASQMLKVIQLKFLHSYLSKPDESYVRLRNRWEMYVKNVNGRLDNLDLKRDFVKRAGSAYVAAVECVRELNSLIDSHDQYSYDIDTEAHTDGLVNVRVKSHIDMILTTDRSVKLMFFTKGSTHSRQDDPAGFLSYRVAFSVKWLMHQGITPTSLIFVSFTAKGTHFIREVSYTNGIDSQLRKMYEQPINTSVDLSKCTFCPGKNICTSALKRRYG